MKYGNPTFTVGANTREGAKAYADNYENIFGKRCARCKKHRKDFEERNEGAVCLECLAKADREHTCAECEKAEGPKEGE